MSRFHKIAAFLLAVISFSKEDAFAIWFRDPEGIRPVCVRRASLPHHPLHEKGRHSSHRRKAVSVIMHPEALVVRPVPLYARRACIPLSMRLNGVPAPFSRPVVRFGGFFAPSFFTRPAVRFGGVLAPVPFLSGGVWKSPIFMRPMPMSARPGGLWVRTK